MLTLLPLVIFAGFFTWIASCIYRDFAKKKGLTAELNFRTLHAEETPKGGGLIVALIANLFIYLGWYLQIIDDYRTLLIFILGMIISVFGFIDDIRNIKAPIKLFFQIIFSFLVLIIVFPIGLFKFDLQIILFFMITIFFLTWNLNTINFMDGIDGLASSIGISIFISSLIAADHLDKNFTNEFELAILISCFLGFLVVNLSKNKLFMGDSGSLFLGLMINFILIKTIYENFYLLWFWIIMLSFSLTETIATTTYRLIYIKKWYGAHRSHAYQNLARIKENHLAVTLGVSVYHIFWLTPLAMLSILRPIFLPLYLFLAISPVLVFNFTYGPRYSDK